MRLPNQKRELNDRHDDREAARKRIAPGVSPGIKFPEFIVSPVRGDRAFLRQRLSNISAPSSRARISFFLSDPQAYAWGYSLTRLRRLDARFWFARRIRF